MPFLILVHLHGLVLFSMRNIEKTQRKTILILVFLRGRAVPPGKTCIFH